MSKEILMLLILILLVLILLVLIILIKKRTIKQINSGEEKVNNILKKINRYKLLSDIMIKSKNGTTQIDHILIGKKGIFVIETKDFSGIIYGDEYSKYWTQIINRNKNQFYNPIWQNYGHNKALENCIKRNDALISVIVFTNKSNIKNIKTETPVIQLKNLKRYIRKYKSEIKLSKKEIDEIYDLIKKSNIDSYKARKRHIKRINRIS